MADDAIDMRGVVVTPTGNHPEPLGMGEQQAQGGFAPGVDLITRAKEAGFNDDEIGSTVAQLRKEASDAGFGQGEIDTFFGQPPFDATPIKKLVDDNIKQATKPEGVDGQPKPVNSFMDALEFGLQSSVSGLLVRGKTPDKQLTEDAPMASRVVAGMATMAGDLPFMAGGALAGGANPITGTAGAFALPAGMRKILMDKYENGEATTFGEFWERASGAMIETGKAWITGAAVGGVGKAVQAAPIASPMAKAAATLGSEVTTMVTVGKALEGEIPQARDFMDAAVVIFGVKAGVKGAAKLRKIYAEKGVKPADLVADMEKDPTILQDVLADNVEVPGAYGKAAKPSGPKKPWEMSRAEFENGAFTHYDRTPGLDTLTAGHFDTIDNKYFQLIKPGEGSVYVTHDSTLPEGYGKSGQGEFEPKDMPKEVFGIGTVPLSKKEGHIYEVPSMPGRDIHKYLVEQAVKDGKNVPQEVLQEYGMGGGQEPPKPPTPPAPPKEPDNPLYAKHIEKTPEQRVLSRISIGAKDTKEPMTWSRLYTMVVDDLHPIEQAVKAATKGQKLETANDPYQLARLSRGSFGKANQMLEYGTYDFKTYENNGPALKEILKPIRKDLNGLRAYWVAKHAIELKEQGHDAGIDIDAAKAVVRDGRGQYDAIVKDGVGFQNRVAKHLLDAGVITRKLYDAMTEAHKAYIPFFRVMDDGGPGGPKVGNTVKNPIKGIGDSNKTLVDPLESIIKNTYAYVTLAERNVVMQKFADLGIGKKVAASVRKTEVSEKEMEAFLKEHGIEGMPEELLTIFRTVREPLKDNEIGFFREGKWEVREVEPDIAAAFKGMDAESANLLVKILAVPAKALRAGAVLSPDFMGRNLIRDQSMAFALSQHGYVPFIDAMRGFLSIAKKDEHFQNWLKAGGAQSALVSIDRQYLQESLFKLTKEAGLGTRAWNVVKSPLEIAAITSELFENSTRLGIFKQASKHGVPDKPSIQAAGMEAREGTQDFLRVGSKMRAMNMMSAFLTAHIGGLDRVARAFKDDPFGMTMRAGISITVPSLLLWMHNREDPRWKEIPRWQKDLFWIVFTEDHIYRIPKAHELGLIFGTIPERLMESMVGDDPDAFKDLEKSIMQTFIPNMIPTAATPIIEQFANRSLFTGSPVVPAELEKQLPEYQYTDYTTETSKAIGRLMGSFPGMTKRAISDEEPLIGGVARSISSPILMENYLRSWTGGLGMYILQLGDKGLREAGVVPDPVKPASTLADLPVIKAFVSRYPSASAQSIQDFHDHYFANKKIRDTWDAKAKEGDLPAMEHVRSLDKSAIVKLDGVQKTLTQQGQLVRMISKNPVYTAEEKRQLIDVTYFRMIEIARFGKDTLRTLDETMNAQP